VRYGDFREAYPEVDVPFAQSLSPNVTIGVRTAEDPAAMIKTIAAAVHSVDPQIALARIRTMDQVKDESLGEDRYTMVLFANFVWGWDDGFLRDRIGCRHPVLHGLVFFVPASTPGSDDRSHAGAPNGLGICTTCDRSLFGSNVNLAPRKAGKRQSNHRPPRGDNR
jgi:hypothetical protein